MIHGFHTLVSCVVAHWLQTSVLHGSWLKVFELQGAECGEKVRVALGYMKRTNPDLRSVPQVSLTQP